MTTEVYERLPINAPEVRSMWTRDGLRLDADVYRPAASGLYPVLLLRQAYGRRVAATVCYAHPSWYAAHGYVVVVQDVRGRGTSQGRFRALENEIDDGADTISWAAQLEGTTGAVGMYGFSYQGSNQLLAASRAGSELRALAPAMFGWNIRESWVCEGGAVRLAGMLGWATQIAADTAKHAGKLDAFEELFAAANNPPLDSPRPALPPYIEKHRDLTHYHRWIETPADDPYWRAVSPSAHLQALRERNLPMLFIGGWYDSFLTSTLEAWHSLAESAPARLVVGPWLHFPWGRKIGDLDFGPEAVSDIDRLQVRWFDHWLKGIDTGLMREPAIRLFDMGTNAWRSLQDWPTATVRLLLKGDGRASVDPNSGSLCAESASIPSGVDFLVHDPWRPVPSVGGAYGHPSGPVDRSLLDARGDVLTFTTAPLEHPWTLVGAASVRLFLWSDAPSFDVSCVLSRVSTSGKVYPIAEGFRRLCSAEPEPMTVQLNSTCITLTPGEALRLSVSAASFPAFSVNPATGADPTRASRGEAQITTLGIAYGERASSSVSITLLQE